MSYFNTTSSLGVLSRAAQRCTNIFHLATDSAGDATGLSGYEADRKIVNFFLNTHLTREVYNAYKNNGTLAQTLGGREALRTTLFHDDQYYVKDAPHPQVIRAVGERMVLARFQDIGVKPGEIMDYTPPSPNSCQPCILDNNALTFRQPA